jgi:hypothetical protein
VPVISIEEFSDGRPATEAITEVRARERPDQFSR